MYAVGIDYGTNSVRCVVLDLESGAETASAAAGYPSGDDGVIGEAGNPHLARQEPDDYWRALEKALPAALDLARRDPGFSPVKVVGIGVDATGSTPLPVDENLVPLSLRDGFGGDRNALAFLWKDHSAADEAEEITALAARLRPRFLARTGGVYSSEWYFSKLLYLFRRARPVFDAMAGFVELSDYIPAALCGVTGPAAVRRGICAAGHKAMFSDDWGGLPDGDFLAALFPGAADLERFRFDRAFPAGEKAGFLCPSRAEKLGLPAGIPVSVGALDAHMGAVGAGVKPGVLVKVIGTSTCDMAVAPAAGGTPEIPGICGIVPGSIIPGYNGIEAGQSAVGDIFHWFAGRFMAGTGRGHDWFSERAATLAPGAGGLLALDWHNGNRTVLVDQKLTGLILGLTLETRPEQVYRALVEATGFGARVIIERLEEYGVAVEDIVAAGGIPGKNPLLVQIYADITGRKMRIAASGQACAVGAALFGAVAAGPERGGIARLDEARERVCRFRDEEYRPCPERQAAYERLYRLYRDVHDAFGLRAGPGAKGLGHVMKELLAFSGGGK